MDSTSRVMGMDSAIAPSILMGNAKSWSQRALHFFTSRPHTSMIRAEAIMTKTGTQPISP